jgi:MFS transporter, DHA3 family, macrolide efflux protein
MKTNPLGLFPDFRWLFLGRLVSAVGDKFFSMALAWWILSRDEDGGKLHMSLLMAVTIVPVVLFSPFIGTLVDRFNKRTCMLVADIGRAILVLILYGLLVSGGLSMPLLYGLVFLLGAFVPLFESAVGASLVPLTDDEHLPAAAALDSNVVQLSNVFGALLGSFALAWAGVEGALLFNAASFLVSFGFIFMIRHRLDVMQESPPFWSEFKAGFAFLQIRRDVLSLMLIFTLINLFFTPIVILIPMLVQEVLKETVTWVAIFEFFAAVGSGIVAFWLGSLNSLGHAYRKIAGAVAIMGLLMMACALPAFLAPTPEKPMGVATGDQAAAPTLPENRADEERTRAQTTTPAPNPAIELGMPSGTDDPDVPTTPVTAEAAASVHASQPAPELASAADRASLATDSDAATASPISSAGKYVLCGLFFGIGGMIALAMAYSVGLFQAAVPPEMKGRFFGILNTVCFAVIPLSFVGTGLLSEMLALPTIFLINGLATMLIAIPVLLIPRIKP